MSWATCYSGSNNIHFNHPPIMSDGRTFSNYLPITEVNNRIKKTARITSNNQYRQYLIKHADKIIETNQFRSCNNVLACANSSKPKNSGDKYIFKSCSDKSTPFGYENSDLKNIYLSREQLNSKKHAQHITQDELLKIL